MNEGAHLAAPGVVGGGFDGDEAVDFVEEPEVGALAGAGEAAEVGGGGEGLLGGVAQGGGEIVAGDVGVADVDVAAGLDAAFQGLEEGGLAHLPPADEEVVAGPAIAEDAELALAADEEGVVFDGAAGLVGGEFGDGALGGDGADEVALGALVEEEVAELVGGEGDEGHAGEAVKELGGALGVGEIKGQGHARTAAVVEDGVGELAGGAVFEGGAGEDGERGLGAEAQVEGGEVQVPGGEGGAVEARAAGGADGAGKEQGQGVGSRAQGVDEGGPAFVGDVVDGDGAVEAAGAAQGAIHGRQLMQGEAAQDLGGAGDFDDGGVAVEAEDDEAGGENEGEEGGADIEVDGEAHVQVGCDERPDMRGPDGAADGEVDVKALAVAQGLRDGEGQRRGLGGLQGRELLARGGGDKVASAPEFGGDV
jgi:hypothetical protein